MKTKTLLRIFSFLLGSVALAFLWNVDWKIAVGVMLFGWMMNIDNATKAL